MRSKSTQGRRPVPVYGNLRLGRAVVFAIVWLVIITALRFSFQPSRDRWLASSAKTIGYMPVFSTASAPLAADQLSTIDFKPVKYTSFANIASAFQAGELTAAFVVAPLALALMSEDDPAVVIYNGLQQESSIVFDDNSRSRRIAVPSILASHNLFVREMLDRQQLFDPAAEVVYLNPPEMVSAMESGSLAGFVVGEPFATEALLRNPSRRLVAVESYQPDFLCNVLIIHQSLLDQNPEMVQDLVRILEANVMTLWSDEDDAIQRLSKAWSWKPDRLHQIWSTLRERVTAQRSVPREAEFQRIRKQLRRLPTVPEIATIRLRQEFAESAQQTVQKAQSHEANSQPSASDNSL